MNKEYLILTASNMSDYTLRDLEKYDNIKMINRCHVFSSSMLNRIFRLHTALPINKKMNMPFKIVWYKAMLREYIKAHVPDYVIMSYPWYDPALIAYIRKKAPNARIILQCADKVEVALKNAVGLSIEIMRDAFDGVVVYNPLDAEKYGFECHDTGYSRLRDSEIKEYPQCDVTFVGAAKNRLKDIRAAYKKFTDAGLSCYFYVTGVPENMRLQDGIIYADTPLSFVDYVSREVASKSLFELVQEGSTGRTYRLMEAVIYNKLLITNCPEILDMRFNCSDYVHYFNHIEDIDAERIRRYTGQVDYGYQGEFSPVNLIEFIEEKF